MNNDEISKNAIVLTANEPKFGGNNRNFPNCNTDKCIAVPNEGNRRNFDNGKRICQYFKQFARNFWKFPKYTDL